MNPVEKNCPYTGLRSFTEDEAVYFRGRDEHIEKSTVQLGEKKFLMVTGASGDGKSSIIYAGMIPFLKAGFLKTEYTRWAVVDFRPERDPFGNFAKALSKHFTHIDNSTIQTELSRGFSSLILLYKNSPLFVDEAREDWIKATEQERKAKRREAANLFILVDQFEEFFTNPENFYHGATSEYAALVVSTLLETARIALKENLPIYIVFTMRSDFIGQCVSFRGLPEYIGFSQFFIPRLNREEIKVVIRDPASLAGYKISDRLVERLLYDIEEGIDQLPILQHSLNRIWHFALVKDEEMDLVHYAMAGGMSLEELMLSDKERMREYISSLPESIQEGYAKPSLRNVLDLHANSLCLEAEKNVKGVDHHLRVNKIIQATFKGLTKIDEERAVRNRMTVTEIASIINDETISIKTVSDALLVFRESGATFLKPYILSEDDETVDLKGSDVLDITHESLIRNWDNLEAWARKEDGHAKIYYELRNHLNHWVNSGHSANFLLTVGVLNYFETWRDELKPNAYWINRYEKNNNPHITIQQSQQLLDQINLFLRKSKWKNIVGRTIVRYGMKNVVAVLVTVLTVVSCSLLFVESRKNQNSGVVEGVKKSGVDLVLSDNVSDDNKARFLVSLYRQDSVYFYHTLSLVKEKRKKLQLDQAIIRHVFPGEYYGYLNHYLYKDVVSLINDLVEKAQNPQEKIRAIELSTQTMVTCYYKSTMSNSDVYKSYISSFLDNNLPVIRKFTESPEVYAQCGLNYKYVHINLETALAINKLSKREIEDWLDRISIFNQPRNATFSFYSKNNPSWGTLKNAIFQMLGIMYSSLGKVDYTKMCFDSLMKKNTDYYAPFAAVPVPPNRYAFSLTFNLLANGYQNEFESINKYIAQKVNSDLDTYYNDFLSQVSWRGANYRNTDYYSPINIDDFDEKYLRVIHSMAAKAIVNGKLSKDDKNFKLAMLYKRLGLHLIYCWTDKKTKIDTVEIYSHFDDAFEYFNKLSEAFTAKSKGFRDFDLTTGLVGVIKLSNYQIFLYPDYYRDYTVGGWRILSDVFFRYILHKGLTQIYRKGNACQALGLWYVHFEPERIANTLLGDKYYHGDIYSKILPIVEKYESNTSLFYPELMKLSAINSGNDIKMTKQNIVALLRVYNSLPADSWDDLVKIITMYNFGKCFADLYYKDGSILSLFKLSNNYGRNDYLLSKMLTLAPAKLYEKKAYFGYFRLLLSSDSVMKLFKDNSKYDIKNPEFNAIASLLKMEDHETQTIVFNIIKESNDGDVKIESYKKRIASLMNVGDYYYAVKAIPPTLSSNYSMAFYSTVLDDYRKRTRTIVDDADPWKYYDANLNNYNWYRTDF